MALTTLDKFYGGLKVIAEAASSATESVVASPYKLTMPKIPKTTVDGLNITTTPVALLIAVYAAQLPPVIITTTEGLMIELGWLEHPDYGSYYFPALTMAEV